ncbi:hypothetical protein [Piscinibacter terrae]|uniref:Uncharacterized protein n=1 Tax=Piscinibacter terrae TaxID=2496871 RepID=A0A3N7HHU0_9BURK|nr:hypothetical protein [Albitalea terrae]RQP21617.1 hypothetical protein DZC73_27305 [Albitalea terrae]
MTYPEITMLRQSAVLVRRLAAATRVFGDAKYHYHRRLNWTYRYDADFYQEEAALFTADVDAYVEGNCKSEPKVADVYKQTIGRKQYLVMLVKIMAHWLFLMAGMLFQRLGQHQFAYYRKAYVDDIELVFPPDQPAVLRAVYPFPVSLRRQVRYLKHLRRTGHPWQLTGNRYGLRDVIRFLTERSLRSLQRLETRAQIRNAFAVAAMGFRNVQLSDEFDLGSLDFCRALARLRIRNVNSAHGVGKYLPVHAYEEFHVLTQRQREYYIATRPCEYMLRMLNARAAVVASGRSDSVTADDSRVSLVFLSGQSSRGIGETYLARNEENAFARLCASLAGTPGIRLLYRPHPNNHEAVPPPGFEIITGLDQVNGRSSTVFVSYSSTCQIDPVFQGRKILIRGEMMYPETWFDDSEEMMTLDELVAELQQLAMKASGRTPLPEAAQTH